MTATLVGLQTATLVSIALGCALFLMALLSAPSPPAERLGLRGHKRSVALRENELFRMFEPLVRWISTRIGGLLSPELRARLNRLITRAGDVCGFQPEDIVSLTLLSSLACASLGIIYVVYSGSGALFAIIAVLLGTATPYLQLSSMATKRAQIIERTLPHVVDLMVLGLGAGLDFAGAVRQVLDKAARSDEPLVEELRLVLQELKLGRTRREALTQLCERVPCEPVRDLVAAVTQSEEQGTPLAAVLASQAAASRQRRSVNAEESAARASNSLMVPLALLFVSVLTLIVSPMVLTLGEHF